MGWLWAAFLWHLPGRKGGTLLLHGHGNYSNAVVCGYPVLVCASIPLE